MTALPTTFITPEVTAGTTTSWLPVTTPYPQLAGCSSAFFLYPGQPFPCGFDPGYGYFAGGDLSCMPPAQTTWWEQVHQNPDGYTSLSIRPIVCPLQWTTAATETRGAGSTLVMCCPTGYNLNGGQPGRVTGICQSPLTAGQAITYTAQNANSTWVSTSLTVASATSINAVAMKGWNVAVETSVTSTATTAATATVTSTQSPSSTPTLQSASSGLSTGAKAGTGVAVAALVIGILVLLFFFVRRVRKRRQVPYATNDAAARPYEVAASGVHEIGQKHGPVHEVQQQGSPVYEMHEGQGYGGGGVNGHTPVELESR